MWNRYCRSNDYRACKNLMALLLLLVSAGLLIFGILSQVLCEVMRYDRGLFQYLLTLVPTGLIFWLMYLGVSYFDLCRWECRFVVALLLILMLLWTLLLGFGILGLHLDEEQFVVYKIYAWTYPRREVQYMLSRSHFWGHGDPYYEYDDSIVEGYEPDQENLPMEVSRAFDERLRAEAVFSDYRSIRTLPVLSYHYGRVITATFTVLGILWCVLGLAVSFQVYLWHQKAIYLICYLAVALQLTLPLLGAYGLIHNWCCIPFAGNWKMNLTFSAPQLGTMLALVKHSRPRPPMLMEPGDDYWHEILEDWE